MAEFDYKAYFEEEFSKLSKSVEPLESVLESINLWRLIGYGLLLLAFFDLVVIFIPPSFMNPAWEFQAMGRLVEQVGIPLIGLMLVFSGKLERRGKWETKFVALLSHVTLLVALLFVLTIPWGVVNTVRLYRSNQDRINTEYTKQVSQFDQVEKQLKQATPADIENFLKRQGRSLEGKNPQELKDQILAGVSTSKQQVKTQTEANRSSVHLQLIKSSVKWNLGALVSAALFISIWKGTRWARKTKP
jgi:hypothetical protein